MTGPLEDEDVEMVEGTLQVIHHGAWGWSPGFVEYRLMNARTCREEVGSSCSSGNSFSPSPSIRACHEPGCEPGPTIRPISSVPLTMT